MSDPSAAARRRMVERQLLARGVDERVAQALGRVPRERFMPATEQPFAYDDSAAPIGWGQTISQPYIVALTCQFARIRPGVKVLDVGTGSGYQAAVLAELGAEVHSIERIPALAERARRTLAGLGYQVSVQIGDGSLGLPGEAPFRAIVAAAAAPALPSAYAEQLEPWGRAVCPVGPPDLQRLLVAVKRGEQLDLYASQPVRFVPMLGASGYTVDESDAP